MKYLLYILISTSPLFFNNAKSVNSNEPNINAEDNGGNRGKYYHAVYFWLKNPSSTEDRRVFESALTRFLKVSKYIVTKHVGIPAETSRKVIDRTYSYSLVLSFKDKNAQDAYQAQESHKLFLNQTEELVDKVVIYDSESILGK